MVDLEAYEHYSKGLHSAAIKLAGTENVIRDLIHEVKWLRNRVKGLEEGLRRAKSATGSANN